MTKILVNTLRAGKYYNQPVYLDDKYILFSPETPLNDEVLNRLKRWSIDYIYSDGEPLDDRHSGSHEEADDNGEQMITGLESEISDSSGSGDSQRFFVESLNFLERVFSIYVKQGSVSFSEVTDQVKKIIEQVNARRQYMLRITEFNADSHNYIVVHSVKATILAVAIGTTMRMPNHKLIELGTATLMHEIGMIKLPSQIYMSNKMLNQTEKKAITAHTVLGYKTLKQNSFPMSVCLGVLECRENVDGTGYPRGLTGDRISSYGKIINIASTYAALTSKRPFRGAFNGHSSIMDMLKRKGTMYDENALRVLILILSVYPLGTYVLLQNGCRGMVVETNEGNYRAPKVRILVGPNDSKQQDHMVVNTEASNYGIVRPLSNEEISKVKKIAATK
ncbi:HD-GYP domain-containing protein [Spirochaeta africana]|uniref:HD-GYP domain-containing protein n=1 Tax=Spirochaeta africana (strain ATCC 700263 / DSM 8902 / Z-7692) TaxID=889378 RepID=H9UKD5_SPIAZ|nr:HD domain-containing phosphohydrolase [Spirochaeta africana]AFG37978.1 HD-GYP domain-containing protein [Spirochaeta africana DSM 8902]